MGKNKGGRPAFAWTHDIEQEIMRRLASGETIMEICGDTRDDFMPSTTTFYKRLSSDDEFADEYARARVAQAHHEADEIRKIADEATPENYNVARLRIDARKWRASKMAPKIYGEKLDLNHAGSLTVTLESDAAKL